MSAKVVSFNKRIRKLEDKIPTPMPDGQTIVVDPKKGETAESVYFREYAKPIPNHTGKGISLVVYTIVTPNNVGTM